MHRNTDGGEEGKKKKGWRRKGTMVLVSNGTGMTKRARGIELTLGHKCNMQYMHRYCVKEK